MLRFTLGVVMLCVLTALLHAGEPQKKQEPETIPAPKVQIPQTPSIIIEPYVVRPGSRDVWQHYGVNSLGRFVPRVIVLPHGAYYSRDLQPYPWIPNRTTAVMPYAVD